MKSNRVGRGGRWEGAAAKKMMSSLSYEALIVLQWKLKGKEIEAVFPIYPLRWISNPIHKNGHKVFFIFNLTVSFWIYPLIIRLYSWNKDFHLSKEKISLTRRFFLVIFWTLESLRSCFHLFFNISLSHIRKSMFFCFWFHSMPNELNWWTGTKFYQNIWGLGLEFIQLLIESIGRLTLWLYYIFMELHCYSFN